MCLYITEVPKTEWDGLVVRAYKAVLPTLSSNSKHSKSYRTIYQSVGIPENGWLVPKTLGLMEEGHQYGRALSGGFIHAFIPCEKESRANVSNVPEPDIKPSINGMEEFYSRDNDSMHTFLPSFAVQVVAYGDSVDPWEYLDEEEPGFEQTTDAGWEAEDKWINDHIVLFQDLVCRALYMPACDLVSSPAQVRANIKFLNRCCDHSGADVARILKRFPFLTSNLLPSGE